MLVLLGFALVSCAALGWPPMIGVSGAVGLALPFLLVHFFWLRGRKYSLTRLQDFLFCWFLAPLSLIPAGLYYLFFFSLIFGRR